MKRILRFAGGLLVCSALVTPAAQAYLTVVGDGTAGTSTFNVAPTNAVFYKPTGEYFFGLSADTSSTANGNYALCYGNYRTPGTAPVLTALGTDTDISNFRVDHLAIAPYALDPLSPTVIASIGATANASTTIYPLNKGNASAAGQILYDGSGVSSITGGIVAMAGSSTVNAGNDVFFAAVRPNAATAFGTVNSGITGGLLTRTAGISGITLYNLATGLASTTATAFLADFTNTATAAFAINGSVAAGAAAAVAATGTQVVDMWYDPLVGNSYGTEAGRVYVAVSLAGTGTAWTVGTFIVNKNTTATPTTLTLTATKSAYTTTVTGVTNQIMFGQAGNGATLTPINLVTRKVRTLHTSTGLAYLILGGSGQSLGTTAVATNGVWAVPLVNNSGVANTDGLPARVNSFNTTTGQYNVPVGGGFATFAIVANTEMITTSSAAAQVGNMGATGGLPCSPGAGSGVNVTSQITDMYVDGDAVYVAVNGGAPTNATGTATEGGLWKSQAVFNDLGQIDHWSDWQKVVPSDMGNASASTTPGLNANGSVDFAAVDGYTGHVWALNNTSLTALVTSWSNTQTNTQQGLAAAVTTALGTKCYSVLDLNASSTGWGANTPLRLAAFGGNGQVCFANTGSAVATAVTLNGTYTALNATFSDATYDYTSSSSNIFFTSSLLPAGAGAVMSLGYSGWSASAGTNSSTPGFFLAGCAGTATTAPALYVSTVDGVNGFNSDLITSFTSAQWVQLTNVQGMPLKIQANGGNLHVLTRTGSLDRIYTAVKSSTATALNASFVVTASSGTGNLATAAQIYDFVISASATPANAQVAGGNEQLLALTSDGIYTTSSSTGMNALVVSQVNAGWQLITTPTTRGFFTDAISRAAYDRSPQDFWFANFVQNTNAASGYNRNSFSQMGRQSLNSNLLSSETTYAADPSVTATFNGATAFNQATASIYASFPLTSRLFYNDGSRRFIVQKSLTDNAKFQILVLPYNLYDYNITTTGKATMPDTLVAAANAFYWMSPIGDTGRLMLSTDNGVIALQ